MHPSLLQYPLHLPLLFMSRMMLKTTRRKLSTLKADCLFCLDTFPRPSPTRGYFLSDSAIALATPTSIVSYKSPLSTAKCGIPRGMAFGFPSGMVGRTKLSSPGCRYISPGSFSAQLQNFPESRDVQTGAVVTQTFSITRKDQVRYV